MTAQPRTAPILVVDDSRTIVQHLMGLLREAGHADVHGLNDSRQVAEACRQLHPDVVLLDYVMPHMDGLTTLDAVLRAGLEPPPAVIMLTGRDESDLRLAALRRGARDFITKPCDPHELVARVANAVQLQQLQRQLHRQKLELEAIVGQRTRRLQEALDMLRQAERRLEDRLAASQAESRGKSEFIASAAHELRTPLHAVIGFADLLKNEVYGPLGDARYVEFAADIHQAGVNLLAFVDGTLDLAKVEAGGERLDLRDIDVGHVVQSSVRMLDRMAAQSGIRLAVKLPESPLVIHSDPDKVRQVILNLGSNAIKFTPKGGQVTVEARPAPDGGALILVVRDTGIGMRKEDIPRALTPFGQVRAPGRPHPKGTGLGLPLTQRFVELLGGTLEIASKPGGGTMVTVRLPLEVPPTDPLPTAADVSAPSAASRSQPPNDNGPRDQGAREHGSGGAETPAERRTASEELVAG